jgi:hypothetical protein
MGIASKREGCSLRRYSYKTGKYIHPNRFTNRETQKYRKARQHDSPKVHNPPTTECNKVIERLEKKFKSLLLKMISDFIGLIGIVTSNPPSI